MSKATQERTAATETNKVIEELTERLIDATKRVHAVTVAIWTIASAVHLSRDGVDVVRGLSAVLQGCATAALEASADLQTARRALQS
jgi:hypothetical protein